MYNYKVAEWMTAIFSICISVRLPISWIFPILYDVGF